MKQNKTLIKELRQELHYHQMMVRVDLNAARAGVRRCREIGAKMRALQNGQAVEHRFAADKGRCGASHHTRLYVSGLQICDRCGEPLAAKT